MRKLYQTLLVCCLAIALLACGESEKLETPLDSLKAYTKAIKNKDTQTMKSLLSQGSLKMAQDEAKAQNVAADEIIARETLFSPDQKSLEFRNEKITGERATIEVKNSFGSFDVIPFVKENGVWKIAKEKYAEEMLKQSEEESRKIEEEIRQSREEEPIAPANSQANSNSLDQPTTIEQELENPKNINKPFNDSTVQNSKTANTNIQNANNQKSNKP